MAKSGDYRSIHVNKVLSTATGGNIASRLRPDISAVRRSGLIDLIEVRSPGQSLPYLRYKLDKIEAMLGDLAGPVMDVIIP